MLLLSLLRLLVPTCDTSVDNTVNLGSRVTERKQVKALRRDNVSDYGTVHKEFLSLPGEDPIISPHQSLAWVCDLTVVGEIGVKVIYADLSQKYPN